MNSVDPIIERVRCGDLEAYGAIVREYQEEVWRVVALTLRSPAATEELVQQAFVRAYEGLDGYQVGRDFGAWIRTIARNLARNELRRASRENDRLRRYRDHVIRSGADDGAADERQARLRAALGECRRGLQPSTAEALDLRYRDGLDFEVIAGRLGRTVAAARQLLQRARVALRACIEERMVRA